MPDSDDLLVKQKEFVDAFFRKGAELASELIESNEKLRFRVVELEAELAAARQKLTGFGAAEAAARRYEARFAEIEHENHNLASLYVAAYQLHATLDVSAVLSTIVEILLNFVGARTFAIYVVDGERLVPIAAQNLAADAVPRPALGDPGLGQVAASGNAQYQPAPGVVAAVPMRLGDSTVGAIAVFELLSHKPALDEVDYELFNLLAAHAATALEAARLAAVARAGGGATNPGFAALASLTPS